jgi:hypothetical protein
VFGFSRENKSLIMLKVSVKLTVMMVKIERESLPELMNQLVRHRGVSLHRLTKSESEI